MDSNTILAALGYLFLILTFILFRPQIFHLIGRLTKINIRGAKNLEYTDEDVETHLPSRPLIVLSRKKILARIFLSLIVTLFIYVVPPFLSRILIDFGNSEFSSGHERLGSVSYNLALELNGKLRHAIDQCRVDNSQKQYTQAVEHCREAIDINDHYAFAYFSRGLAYLNLNQYDQAIADFTTDIDFIPIATRSYINRGLAYMKQGKLDLSVADLTRSIDINSAEPQAWLNRGLAYYQQNKTDLAISDCTRAIELEDNYWNAYFCLGAAFTEQERYELAITNFDKAIELLPDTSADVSTLYCMKGITYFKMGDVEAATKFIAQGINLDRTNTNDFCKSALENTR